MVTTRRGKRTAAPTTASPKAKAAATRKKTGKADAGSAAAAKQDAQQKQQGTKRSVEETADAFQEPTKQPKRQKHAENGSTKTDLQVKDSEPSSLEAKSAVPETDTISAAAAVDPPAGSETAIPAEDLAPTPSAPAEDPKPNVGSTEEMPVEEAVKVIGGTQAGSAPVSEAATAGKPLDVVPVGPDPAAAADDTPQDGDYFLDANLADGAQADEEVKPAKQAAESSGTTDASKNGFLAPPASEAPSHVGGGVGGQTGMAAEAGNALTDIPSGIQADKTAVAHTDLPSAAGNTKDTGIIDAMHEPITSVPTTVDAHDSLFGAAAVQDASDIPAMIGGDNA